MSWFRLGGALDRLSPFTRSPPQGPATVSDADFSYITNDDLKRHAAQTQEKEQAPPADRGAQRDTDTLTIRVKNRDHVIHFPAYSIDDGELLIRSVREATGKKLGIDAARLKLMYRGRPLRDDSRPCRAEGLMSGSEILCTFPGSEQTAYSESGGSDEDGTDAAATSGNKKKRKSRSNKNKKQKRNENDNETGSPPPSSQSRAASGMSTPLTAKDKLIGLRATLDSYDQDVQQYRKNPPPDTSKRDFEHKRLSETILTQVLLKIDAVDTEGDPDARAQRKELVKDTQNVLKSLDDAHDAIA